jgi:hypothetical protein
MDVREKVVAALSEAFAPAYVRLEDDDGISGFVVSPQFEGLSAVDRQGRIEEALTVAPRLTEHERRRVLMIAGLTPVEYDAVGVRIRVEQVKERAEGIVEVLVEGGWSDAEYVRGALNNQKGVKTTEPRQVSGPVRSLMSFRAKRTGATPLTKEIAIRVLKKDGYIEVAPSA